MQGCHTTSRALLALRRALCGWCLELYFTFGLTIPLAGSWLLKLDVVLYPCPERELGRRCGVGPIRMGQDRLEGENVANVGGGQVSGCD